MASIQSTAQSSRPVVRSRRRFRPGYVVGLFILAALGWWGWQLLHPKDTGAAGLITAPVTRGDLVESVSATGSVTAQTGAMVKIGSQITGRIKRLYADVGSEVKAGSVIAELDLPDIEAQLNQAQANLAAARSRLAQQISGVGMQQAQTSGAITQAQAEVASSRAKLAAAEAGLRLQNAQTPSEIKRAQTALKGSKAALSTAKSNLVQVQAGTDLQISVAQEQLNQAQANAKNSAVNLQRKQSLLKQGFVSASEVDTAVAADAVAQSQVTSARKNVDLVKQKVAADTQAAKDLVDQAQQNVESAKASLDAANAGTFQNNVKQADVNDARESVKQAESALQTARANTTQNVLKQQDIDQAREAVSAAEQQVKYYQAQKDKTSIHSPITGTVLQLAAQQGETLAAGLSAPTLIIVADLNRLQVDAFVDETDIGKVKLGQAAEVRVDAFPKRAFKGHVAKVASGSTIQQGVVTYDVTIALDDTGHRLKPDMTASVTIQTGTRPNVLLIPSEALKVSSKGRGATVNVVTKKDGRTEIVPKKVRTGASDGINTEIRDGLNEGDVVVLAGLKSGPQRAGPSSPFGPTGGGGGGGGGRRGGG